MVMAKTAVVAEEERATAELPIPNGFKQTEVGVIPEDWEVASIGCLCKLVNGRGFKPYEWKTQGIPIIRIQNINGSEDYNYFSGFYDPKLEVPSGQLLYAWSGSRGTSFGPHVWKGHFALLNYHTWKVVILRKTLDNCYFFHALKNLTEYIEGWAHGASALVHVQKWQMEAFQLPLPPTRAEQEAIAEALSDADALIEGLDQLIAKKRHLKQGAMQELLTGKTRLPGFSGELMVKTLKKIADCLDNLRIPLNDAQREKMKGDYPYCGANGVLDYINRYVIDDDIILIAEDGGYFDEYAYRPIAYRMRGKCWVNNHAHILIAKAGFDQAFVFYSLVHKNILNFLASGTRAKLNKSEMNKIEVRLPSKEAEQTAIATILSDMDTEIAALEAKLVKARAIKQGMMQELLTGRVRLI